MLRSILLTAVAFAIVGPLVGILGLAGLGFSQTDADAGGAALGLIWLLPFAYLIGGLPAALTGAVVGLIAGCAKSPLYVFTGVAVSAVFAGLVGWFGGEGVRPLEGVINLILLGAAAGLFSTLAGLLLRRRRPTPTA